MGYSAFLALAFTVGITIAGSLAESRGNIGFKDFRRFCLIAMGGSLVGARVFHVFFEGYGELYRSHPWLVIDLFRGGLSVWGGLMGAFLGLAFAFRRRWTALVAVADIAAPAFLVGTAIARVGCWVEGCCFGTPSVLPWATIYGHGSHAWTSQVALGAIPRDAAHSLPVHPSQLYEALGATILGLGLTWVVRWCPSMTPGLPFSSALGSYGALRFLVEFWRADPRGSWNGAPLPQIVAAMAVLVATTLVAYRRRRLFPNTRVSFGPVESGHAPSPTAAPANPPSGSASGDVGLRG